MSLKMYLLEWSIFNCAWWSFFSGFCLPSCVSRTPRRGVDPLSDAVALLSVQVQLVRQVSKRYGAVSRWIQLKNCLIKHTWARFFHAASSENVVLSKQKTLWCCFKTLQHLFSISNLVESLSISNAVNDQHRPGKSGVNLVYDDRNASRIWFIEVK